MGYDTNGNQLFSFIQFLVTHILVIASSGAGKTNLSYHLILQVAKTLKGLWLYDFFKEEFGTKLKSRLAQEGINLIVLPIHKLKINPMQLPIGVPLSSWIPRLADMLCQVFELPPRASKILQAKLFILFDKFDIENGNFPTLFDLYEIIKEDKELNHQARMAILDNFEPVLRSLGPKVLAYRYGWPSNELAKHHIAFELGGGSETAKNLILNSTILSEFISRISRGISNTKMDLMIFADEAQRLCSSAETSPIASLIGLVRGSGIGLDLSLQSTYQLLPQIVSNTATKILGRCGSIADFNAAGHSMGLSPEQIHWAQMNLCPGQFVGQLGEGSWRHPFVFKVPLIKLSQNTPANLYDINPFPELKTVYASEFDTWGQIPQINLPVENKIFDSEQELEFCKAVANNPMQPSSAYPKIAGISSKNAKKIREQLITKGFITEHKLDSTSRGRSTILLEILPAGFTAIQKYQEQMR